VFIIDRANKLFLLTTPVASTAQMHSRKLSYIEQHCNALVLKTWGRCYDYNFLRFSAKKIGVLTNVMIKILHILPLI
jgi:hypothetical protein